MTAKNWTYITIAFVAGFVLMTFELVAARMLAPTIGTSIFVWTNVLGVIMGALAFGYYLGGKFADKRKQQMDIVWLLLATAASIAFILIIGDQIVSIALSVTKDARWQGLMVAIALFAAPSLLLGMLSPYLAKFSITSTKTSGNAVAGLSAANAVGSIVGTFATGFILFGLIGGQTILVSLAIVSVGISWLIAPKSFWKIRALVSIVAVLAALVPVLATNASAVTIDTASARYVVVQGKWLDGREVTGLISGPKGIQSAVYNDGSRDLVFWYSQQAADVIDQLHDEQDDFKVLVLGGGAFIVPDYLAHKYAAAQIDVVEIDPQLFPIAKDHFGVEDRPNLAVYNEDARSFVRHAAETYDFILVDVTYDIAMPWQFATREFGDSVVDLLSDDGAIMVNMVGSPTGGCEKMYNAVYGIYARHLPYRYAINESSDPKTIGSVELVFSGRELSRLAPNKLEKEIATTYSDAFAPIEHLLLSCQR